MKRTELVYEKFLKECDITKEREFYFPKKYINSFWEGCLKHEIFIVGYEGFINKDGGIMPHLGCIEDYSWLWKRKNEYSWDSLVKESVKLAQAHIPECLEECDVFTFVLFDEDHV